MSILLLFWGCAQEFRLEEPEFGGGGVIQLDGTPEEDEELEPQQGDPTSPAVSTAGTRFPFAFLEGPNLGIAGPPSFELWIEAEAATDAEIVSIVSDFGLQVSLQPGVNVVPIPNTQLEPLGSGFVSRVGLELLTQDPVHAVAVHHRVENTEATRLLPYEELGVNYVVIAVPDDDEQSPSSFAVLATEDETELLITPSVVTRDFKPAFLAYPVTLQSGEVLQVQADGDLSNSRVFATKKVAVFSGGTQPTVDCAGANHTWEQLPPLSRWATDWLVSPWPAQPYQYALVVATDLGTAVTLDCGEPRSLGPGQVERIRLEGPGRIRSNRPVLVMQLGVGGTCERADDELALGDPNLLLASRTVLSRGDLTLRPAEHPTLLRSVNSPERTDGAVLFRDPMDPLSLLPSGTQSEVTVDDRVALLVELDSTTTVQATEVQGFLYAATEGNGYAHDVGVDCEGCGPRLLEPSRCD